MKKFLAIVLALTMVIALAACGVSTESAAPAASSGDSQAAAPAASGGIRLFNGKIEIANALNHAAEVYEAATGKHVEVESIGGGVDLQSQLKQYYQAGNMPDIFTCEGTPDFSNWTGMMVDMADQPWAADTEAEFIDSTGATVGFPYTTEAIGTPKTLSAENAVKALNPDCMVKRYDVPLTPDNIMEIITEYDFILDCTDRFETKFLINDACVLAHKPYVHAGVVRFEGQAMTYVPGKGPCLRCLMGDVPHDAVTCKDVGVLGAAVGVLGSIQALEAVKYLTGAGDLLCGKILTFDGLTMNVRVHSISHADPECAVCGNAPTIHSLADNRQDYQVLSCQKGGERI